MSPFRSILVPLDGSQTAAASLGCAWWLADRLGARVHVVSATARGVPAEEALAHLKVPEEDRARVELHQIPGSPDEAILAAATDLDAPLVLMSARGEAASSGTHPFGLIGHVTRAIMERSTVPVLVLPPAYRERLPWAHVLVPISGEVETDAVLVLAVRLANALAARVHVAHVTDAAGAEEGLGAEARYADAMHHEYPGRLEELASRFLPQCSLEERGRIEEIALCHGEVAEALLEMIDRARIGLLVVGWHGRFATGHAEALKRVLGHIACPVLLVKPVSRGPFRLRVGEELEAPPRG